MDKKLLSKQEEKLLKIKERLESQLGSFAKESEESEDDWEAKMPSFDQGKSLEEEADEVEEFDTRLALERTLEKELKKVNHALDKIKKGRYGVCEKCGKSISSGRLDAYPQAGHCKNCS